MIFRDKTHLPPNIIRDSDQLGKPLNSNKIPSLCRLIIILRREWDMVHTSERFRLLTYDESLEEYSFITL